jgi:hypothetical protein
MTRLYRPFIILAALGVSAPAHGQQPAWSYPALTTATPPAPLPQAPPSEYVPVPPSPISTGLPERMVLAGECPPSTLGQQHWVSINLGIFQPFTGRLGVKVWSRPNNSVWLEAYGGSVLFEAMYGFGVRVQHTAREFGDRDRLMVSPGLGIHIVPSWQAREKHHGHDPYLGPHHYYEYNFNTLYYLAGDIDISWLHDFSPYFAYELGIKLGLAGRLSGRVGDDYPSGIMWGKNLYPILSLYTGFRF